MTSSVDDIAMLWFLQCMWGWRERTQRVTQSRLNTGSVNMADAVLMLWLHKNSQPHVPERLHRHLQDIVPNYSSSEKSVWVKEPQQDEDEGPASNRENPKCSLSQFQWKWTLLNWSLTWMWRWRSWHENLHHKLVKPSNYLNFEVSSYNVTHTQHIQYVCDLWPQQPDRNSATWAQWMLIFSRWQCSGVCPESWNILVLWCYWVFYTVFWDFMTE